MDTDNNNVTLPYQLHYQELHLWLNQEGGITEIGAMFQILTGSLVYYSKQSQLPSNAPY